VGSSREGLKVARAITKAITPFCDPILWKEHHVFQAGEQTLESIARVAPTFDLAIMVWTADDAAVSRGATSQVPRDNLILEFGYFAAALGRHRCLVVADAGVRTPSDVRGLT
jgi:predicted nucleotide-binding protein